MAGVDPFANIPQDKENDVRFLLQKVYDALCAEMRETFTAIKGKIGEQESRLKKAETSLAGWQSCPCPKRYDPKAKCALYVLENEVYRNKWRNAGIYTGFFLAGVIIYHAAFLVLQWLRI